MALFGNCQYSKPGQLPLLGRNNKNCPTQSFNSLHCNKIVTCGPQGRISLQKNMMKIVVSKVFIDECVFQRHCIDVDETVPKFCSLQE